MDRMVELIPSTSSYGEEPSSSSPNQAIYEEEEVEQDGQEVETILVEQEEMPPTMGDITISSRRLVQNRYLEREQRQANIYVNNIANKYSGRHNPLSRCRIVDPEKCTPRAIRARLLHAFSNCDVDEMVCGVSMCGRMFTSIEIFAYHLSYAHQDLSSKSARSALCLICGAQLESAKGKTVHLMIKHRTIAEQHNRQCLGQRECVISPLAPAAIRLACTEYMAYDFMQQPEFVHHNTVWDEDSSTTINRDYQP